MILIDAEKWSKDKLLRLSDSFFTAMLAAAATPSLWSTPGLPTPGRGAELEMGDLG